MQNNISNRYLGHVSLCEIDYPGQQAILNSSVLIVGVGGLGSPVAMYLAAAGIGRIGLVDADTVSLSNLQRQIIHKSSGIGQKKVDSARQTLIEINPATKVATYPTMLSDDNCEEIASIYDIIVDCTDSRKSRMLVNNICLRLGKPMVFGAVSRFSGIVFTHLPGTADYNTFFTDGDDDEETSCARNGILNTVVGITGSIQATEVIKIITHTGDRLTNRLLSFDALTMTFNVISI